MDSSKNIRLTFKERYPEFNFDNDGEKSNQTLTYGFDTVNYSPAKQIKVLKRKE